MSRTRITFDEVCAYGQKSVKCPSCGKKLKRSRKFFQTLNPFNKLPDGTPKNRKDIYAELSVEIASWKKEPETCALCQKP
jgi:hypothetical protein